MPRIIITVTEQMDTDLKRAAEKRGATVANLVRLYIAQGLAGENGSDPAEYRVEWGGKRREDHGQDE